MKIRSISLLLLFCLYGSVLTGADLIELIDKGKINEARREIARSSSAALREGNLLYGQARLETDGQASWTFLDAAAKSGLSPKYLEDNRYLSALFFQAGRDYDELESIALDYLRRWENGKHRPEIMRIVSQAMFINNKKGNSLKYQSRLTDQYMGERPGFIAELDRAHQLYLKKDYIAAQNICRRLANTNHDEVVAPALFMLSYYAIEQRRIDDAILYYNLLREGYPDAIGLSDLVDRFAKIESKIPDGSAEDMTGTIYSIQVGVFADKKNARNFAKRLEKYDRKVEIKEKKISDQKYHVVYVGRFKTTADALSFKTLLETAENSVFQIVAR
jgi:hypothetical protein